MCLFLGCQNFDMCSISYLTYSVALQSLKDLGCLTYGRFLKLLTFGGTSWTTDESVTRPVPKQGITAQNVVDKHPCFEKDLNPQS
jgi:hypothetical protein